MPWVKDVVTLAPRVAYIAPANLTPLRRIIFDPKPKKGDPVWLVEYAYIDHEGATVADVEHLMGL